MRNVIITWKNMGETPLECLERTRIDNKIAKVTPMTYAGRLDPLAEGVLVILVGEECKNKEKYLGMDKEYEVEVLFGIETDSHDVLGMIRKMDTEKGSVVDKINWEKYAGKFSQEYPRYSSKVIAMKEVPDEMPVKDVEIYSIDNVGERTLTGLEIAEQAIEKVEKVKGDFRQSEVVEEWRYFAEEFSRIPFKIVKLKITCSSGTYMRSLAQRLGGLAWSIKRVRVGEFI